MLGSIQIPYFGSRKMLQHFLVISFLDVTFFLLAFQKPVDGFEVVRIFGIFIFMNFAIFLPDSTFCVAHFFLHFIIQWPKKGGFLGRQVQFPSEECNFLRLKLTAFLITQFIRLGIGYGCSTYPSTKNQ